MKNQELVIVQVFRDGELKAQFEGQDAPAKALGFLHKQTSMSASWALEHEGFFVMQYTMQGSFHWTPKSYGI